MRALRLPGCSTFSDEVDSNDGVPMPASHLKLWLEQARSLVTSGPSLSLRVQQQVRRCAHVWPIKKQTRGCNALANCPLHKRPDQRNHHIAGGRRRTGSVSNQAVSQPEIGCDPGSPLAPDSVTICCCWALRCKVRERGHCSRGFVFVLHRSAPLFHG